MSEIPWQPLFDTIYLGSLAIWIGSLAFWLFGIAPLIRSQPPGDQFRRLQQEMLVRSCYWTLYCTALALASLVYGALITPSLRGARVGVSALLMILAAAILFYVVNSLVLPLGKPAVVGTALEDKLQRRAGRLLTVALLIGLVLLMVQSLRGTVGHQLAESSNAETIL